MLRALPAPSRTEDQDLVRKILARDVAAQRELFARMRGRVHATLYRILGSNRDMEDVAQEAFVQIFRSLASWRGECSLATWSDRIAARAAGHYLARRAPPAVRLDVIASAPVSGPDPAAAVEQRELARRLYAILDRLEPKYRVAFALHVIDGRSLAEVAEVIDTSVVAAKLRVWRARRQVFARARVDAALSEWLQRRSP